MGRRTPRDPEFEVWRSGFRRELADQFGDDFAAAAMLVLDDETEAFGQNLERDRALLEVIVPGRVLAARRWAGAHG